VVPSDALVISEDAVVSEPAVAAWVCDNVTASGTGEGSRSSASDHARRGLPGAGSTAWVPTGARVTVLGGPVLLYVDPAATVSDEEGFAKTVSCPGLALDLSLAPEPGC
jgi:hypothetical protein